MKKNLLVVLCLICYNYSIAQIDIMDGFDLGKYNVGFKHEVQTDYSRAYGDTFRPIQLFIWYPSEVKTNQPFYYSDYFLLKEDFKGQTQYLANESKAKLLDSMIQQEIDNFRKNKKIDIKISKYKELQTIARRAIPVSAKSFPLIVMAPGGNTSGHLYSVLCEYLASHGYIVLSLPSLGNSPGERWPFDQTGLSLQIDDMAFAINHISRSMNEINIEKTGLISWSVGGVAQGIFAVKNKNIDLLISLDSGLGRSYGISMLKESDAFDFKKFDIPFLHMSGKQPEIYKVARSTEFYDSIASLNKFSLLIEPFAHQHFAAQIGVIPEIASENGDATIIKSYTKMCHLTLLFVDAFLKNDIESQQEWMDVLTDH